ncbi:hypothetical protein ACOSQ2_012114 [Xanthoceras sorbifolium]
MAKINFLIFIITSFLVQSLMLSFVMTAAATNITTDQHALLALKDHITRDPTNILAKNWSTSTSICTWIGVTCGLRHHRVITLNISYFGLAGTIPPQLGNMSFLQVLAIRNNSFFGSLPDELAQLRRLKHANFMFNSFNMEIIPSWFGSLSKLLHLFLNNNNFVGTIPLSLGNISSMQVIDLSYNQLSGTIPSSIFQISSLERLDLSDNQLSGEIPHELGNLKKLVVLSLFNNTLRGPIPSTVFNLSSLRIMDFTGNSLTGNLPPEMCQYLPALQELEMSTNKFSGRIPNNLWQCTNLRIVSLSHNQFGGSIPRDIGNLTMLTTLFLGFNNLIGKIPSEIGKLRNLQVLGLQNSKLAGIVPETIFNISTIKEISLTANKLSGSLPSIGIDSGLPNLERLFLDVNNFSGTIPKSISNVSKLSILEMGSNLISGSIPPEIGVLHNLMILNLKNNSLSGLIPSAIFNISKLEVISLYENRLTGHLPSSIGLRLPNLKALYLWGNELNGVIPNSVSNASQLIILELAGNSFSGPIPSTLGELRNLQRLNIGWNQLTREPSTQELTFLSSLTNCKHLTRLVLSDNPLDGTFPTSIGNLSAILTFSANDCKIKGSILQSIGSLSHLTNLGLENNELTGSIPIEIGDMRQLQVLNLNGNRLQGSIPSEICNLRNLGDLYLSDNKFFGPVPTCLSYVTSLRVLHLSSNNLTSKIPSSLWSLGDIVDLNLSNNSLIGHLPMDIGNLRVVTHIDLAWNELSGEIPSNIGNIQTLINFSIAHNKLKGRIPKSFGELVSLELLDLSSNNLSGAIPKSLEKLRYLKYMNMSFNRLDGEIPTGGAFANFSAESFMGNGQLCGTRRLQVPPCKTGASGQSKMTKSVLLISILFAIASAIVVLALTIQWFRSQKRKANSLEREDVSTLATWRRIPYDELYCATNGFDGSNLLGRGGFGSVYKGKLLDGKDIAVKVFNLQVERALKSFDDECEVMSKICHRNLVKIISCYSNFDFKALILEYMPNGSLEKWLYSHNYFLDILQRLNIMIDVTSALEYLHHGYGAPIVHSDIKPSNVMLDEDMVAHVGDFGIAKLLGEEDSMTQTHTLATVGYMAPEYGSEGIVSVRRDVYNFGILLMETFTRKKPTDNMFEGGMSLKCWVQKALPQSVNEVADANLLGEENFTSTKDCISSILELAVDCSEDLPERRLEIINVLRSLVDIITRFQKSVATK